MNESGSSETNNEIMDRASRYRSLQKSELERLAVSAILEHRRLLAADEAIYEEWVRSTADPTVQGDLLRSLQDEYLSRQKKSGAQQEELSEIIAALGYVPPVPSEGSD
jgi:hypothetical protein